MMKKSLVYLICLILTSVAYAADFKVGEAKYEVLSGNSVMLKDYKKATGAVTLPSKVSDPKGGAEYTLTSIGKEAFKKSAITSITLPSTVKEIGEKAFMDCANLKSVKLSASITDIPRECFANTVSLTSFDADFNKITSIGNKAFSGSAVSVEPVYIAVWDNNTYNKYGLVSNEMKKKGFNPIIVIYPSANEDVAANLLKSRQDPVIAFTDRFAGQHALDILKKVYDSSYIHLVERYVNDKSYVKDFYHNYTGKLPSLRQFMSDQNTEYHRGPNLMIVPRFSAYFGAEVLESGLDLYDDHPSNAIDALEIISNNKIDAKFRSKLQRFIQVAIESPEKLRFEYRNIEPEEAVKYNTEVTNAVRVLIDSVYLVKPELNKDEVDNMQGFIHNLLMGIGADYGIANMNLTDWARKDILNMDLSNGSHKEDYERILMSAERFLKYPNIKTEDYPYTMALQLAALCGTERWKEAAAYFPKVHRGATDNGTDPVPYEIEYIQKAINDHGYKAVAPTYQVKKAKGGSKSAKGSSDDGGSLIEFFTDAAIKMGVERYQKKKAEKEFRELYYQSMGLDKKGRPKKKK